MQIYSSIHDLRNALAAYRHAEHKKIILAPTMGSLHDGHISLIHQAQKQNPRKNGIIVSSIFVNRLQFGPNEDFSQYPRNFEDDCEKLRQCSTDILFAPDEAAMYPEPQSYQITLPQSELEGEARPGHFSGVATIVLKLFNIVQPDVAIFGKKDYQQFMMIRTMVQQFSLPIEIIGSETIRDKDGLALSSRNAYLKHNERQKSPQLYAVLNHIKQAILDDEQDYKKLEQQATAQLDSEGWKTDYIAIRRQTDLHKPSPEDTYQTTPLVILGAAKLGETRLLDNLEV